MKLVSEKNKRDNSIFSMRVGMIAYIIVILTIVDEAIGNEIIGIFVGITALIVTLYGIKGKWINKINNKEMLRRVIDYGTTMSIFVFAVSKVLVFPKDVIIKRVLLFIYLIGMLTFIVVTITDKKRKYYVD